MLKSIPTGFISGEQTWHLATAMAMITVILPTKLGNEVEYDEVGYELRI